MLQEKMTGVKDPLPENQFFTVIVSNGKLIFKNISLSGTVNIVISDILGKQLYEETIQGVQINNNYEINAILPSGLYICRIITGQNEYSQKIQIVR
jgi:hypothetical protein